MQRATRARRRAMASSTDRRVAGDRTARALTIAASPEVWPPRF